VFVFFPGHCFPTLNITKLTEYIYGENINQRKI